MGSIKVIHKHYFLCFGDIVNNKIKVTILIMGKYDDGCHGDEVIVVKTCKGKRWVVRKRLGNKACA